LVRFAVAMAIAVGGVVLVRVLASAIPSMRERSLEERVRRHRATPAEMVQLGEKHLLRGEALRAAELAFEARKAAPELVTAHNLLGAVYGQAGETDKAQVCFERAVALAPELLQPRLNLARMALDRQDGLKALGYLQPVQKLHGEDATLWLLTGRAYRVLERSATAHHAFRKAVELDPTLAGAHVELGLLHIAFDRPALAVPPLEEALRLGDRSPENRGRLALALTTGPATPADMERARKLLAEGGGPVTSFGWLAQGLVLHHQGDYPGARRELSRVLEVDPNQERALFAVAETYRAQGDRTGTLRAMQRFQKVVKERQQLLTLATRIREKGATPARLQEYGQALLSMGRAAEALTQFRTWETLAQKDPAPREWVRRALAKVQAQGAPQ